MKPRSRALIQVVRAVAVLPPQAASAKSTTVGPHRKRCRRGR